MDEDYLISTTMWRDLTRQVFYTRGTTGMSFKWGQHHASADWKRNYVT